MSARHLGLALALSIPTAFAAPKVGPTQVHVFSNPSCAKTDTCSLKEFRIEVTPVQDPGTAHGFAMYNTQMVASHETATLAEIKDYGIVQFIRGCVFDSRLVNGQVVKSYSETRTYFGMQDYTFHHPQWGVDKDDFDPLYNENELGRFANSLDVKPNPFENQDLPKSDYFYYANPKTPRIYVSDSPMGSSLDKSPANAEDFEPINASLEFQTCVFRTSDVPTRATPDWDGLSNALDCYHWTASYVYDFKQGRFNATSQVDPFCLAPRTGAELTQDAQIQHAAE